MARLLLVEDEHIVRLSLISLVDWESNNIQIVGEATNGKQALDFLNSNDVDLIITDINMPVMNGLELISEVKKRWPSLSILVLSAYDDYNLVRQAFKLGIQDYILKSEMEPEQVLDLVLKTIRSNVSVEDSSSQSFSNIDKAYVLKCLSDGTYIENMTEEKLNNNNFRFDTNKYYSCVILLDDFKQISSRFANDDYKELIKHIINIVSATLSKQKYGEVICINPEIYHIILTNQSNSLAVKRRDLETLLKAIQHSLKAYLDVSISVGISKEASGLFSLHHSYTEAYGCARLRYLYGKGNILFSEDANLIRQREFQRILGKEKALLSAIKELDERHVILELNNVLELISSFKSESIKDLIGYYLELIFALITELNNFDSVESQIFEHNTNFYAIISQFETKEEIHNWFRNFVTNIINYMVKSSNDNESYIIRQVKKFIKTKYMQRIGLAEVAEYVELSEGYLSRLFVNETGETFVHYLTRIRMEEAVKLLLDTNMKVYEVSEAVGYDNYEHFSRVFKKTLGMSPNAYKRNSLGG